MPSAQPVATASEPRCNSAAGFPAGLPAALACLVPPGIGSGFRLAACTRLRSIRNYFQQTTRRHREVFDPAECERLGGYRGVAVAGARGRRRLRDQFFDFKRLAPTHVLRARSEVSD